MAQKESLLFRYVRACVGPNWHSPHIGSLLNLASLTGVDSTKFKSALRNRPWNDVKQVPVAEWTCGYCGAHVGSDKGWSINPNAGPNMHIRICSNCGGPTFFLAGDAEYAPSPMPGREVERVPAQLASLFHDARASAGAGAPTAAVLACRKILMHVAVQEGAPENQNFVAYVNYLVDNHFAPPRSEAWVDYIRKRGNDANHEIELMTTQNAQVLIKFVEMLLQFLYEAPGMVPEAPDQVPPSGI